MFQIHFHKFSTDVQIYQIFYVILAVLGMESWAYICCMPSGR